MLLCCNACSFLQPSADRFGAREITFDKLSGWPQDDHVQALQTFVATCPFLAPKGRPASSGSGLQVSAKLWQSLCSEGSQLPPGDQAARRFFERRFTPFRITNNDNERGLFTGYYEPLLHGSYKKQGNYKYPVYAAPADLKTRTPYYTHAQISRGVLKNRGLELVWVDDPVMLFFMQIQGSGRVRFKDKSEILLGYAGKNGHAYESIGKIAGDEGLIPKDEINFFTLRQWLYDHPQQAFALMQRNPSYVFFRKLEAAGPVGAAGAVLTRERSLAVDSKYIPYGLPLFLETEIPGGGAFHRTMIAQDTGGAIKGPVRGDIFFGYGKDAEYRAGYMKGRGVYSLLVPNEIADQLR